MGFLGGASGLSSVAARAGEDILPSGPAPEVTPWPSTATTNRYWGRRVQGFREKVGGCKVAGRRLQNLGAGFEALYCSGGGSQVGPVLGA